MDESLLPCFHAWTPLSLLYRGRWSVRLVQIFKGKVAQWQINRRTLLPFVGGDPRFPPERTSAGNLLLSCMFPAAATD